MKLSDAALRPFEWTDDSDDPCALCVGWEEQDDDPMAEHARPYLPSGYVARVYRATHPECQRSAIAYSMESGQ